MTRRAMVASALIYGRVSHHQDKALKHKKTQANPTVLLATWYGSLFDGKEMANGEIFNMMDPSIAASPTLPLGTRLNLKNVLNGRTWEVVVKDRMAPGTPENHIDLSLAAAKWLRFDLEGRAPLLVLARS